MAGGEGEDNHEGEPSSRPFLVEVVPGDDSSAAAARRVELEVFSEVFQNSKTVIEREYGPYEASSEFIVVWDTRVGEAAGMVRLITPSEAGFKSVNDLERDWGVDGEALVRETVSGYRPEEAIDVGSYAIRKAWRGRRSDAAVRMLIYHTYCRVSELRGIRIWHGIADQEILPTIQSFGEPYRFFPELGPREYIDSPNSLPVWSDFPVFRERLRRERPDIFPLIMEGAGLDQVAKLAFKSGD
jgi:hypothetical protein